MNWITYKERILTVIGARGLMWYVDGQATKPIPYALDAKMGKPVKPDSTPLTATETKELDNKIDEFYQKDSLVKQQIFRMITDRLLLCVQKLEVSAKIWAEVCVIHKGKTELVQIDLRHRLQDMRCEEGGDIKAHFGELL
ncbi:hypothetical protein AZE42_12827 [Rhizopogon vesiculosus]|uniref:Uncharacterized protein n=1 Tax=Rhizopogon vesiculosus TaxID=180088 RepID=A0A1J8QHR7_9AGAM|nr:hypothetical protein AZE42_12827 [Rhizopogon vesiculosus]